MPMTPARRVTLILGVPVAFAFLLAAAYNAVTQTYQVGYHVHVSAPPGGQRARVSIDNADAIVRPGADSRIVVDGTLRGSLRRPAFSWRPAAAGLVLHSSCLLGFTGQCTMAYEVSVPRGLPVTVTDATGNLTVSGFSGQVTLSDGSGDITLTFTKTPERVDVTDGSGDITLILPRGSTAYQVRARSASGDVSDALKTSPSSPNVIIASDGSGDVSIGY
jgi:Putative adhesin